MKEVRLTDENGEQVGIVSIQDALARAEEAELDLVEISPNAEPPVCRIMNYGKFIYEKEKAAKEQKKKQKVQVQMKATTKLNYAALCVSWKMEIK